MSTRNPEDGSTRACGPRKTRRAAHARSCFAVAAVVTSLSLLTTVLTLFRAPKVAKADEDSPPARANTYVIVPGPNAAFELQGQLINAVPGDVIQLEAGRYVFRSVLDVVCDNITIRGRGMDVTVLTFEGQEVGKDGVKGTGNAFVMEDIAVEDSVGNAVKVLGADGVVFRRVRAEWTKRSQADNGAYGLYPVQCRNVLIEECVAIGASDAGIYVGQCHDVVVRNCRAEANVAGIEIENTVRADVYNNVATGNTGGLLVFDLPGLQVVNGGNTRVFRNRVVDNNLKNFASPGNMVAGVPAGTGVQIMAANNVEVFDNEIHNHRSTNISILSFQITGRPIKDAKYDPYAEGIFIHDNRIGEGGHDPDGEISQAIAKVIGPFPDILYDGFVNPQKLVDGKLPDDLSIRLADNGDVTFANINYADFNEENIRSGLYRPSRDPKPYVGQLARLAPVKLDALQDPQPNGNPAVAVYRRAPGTLSEWGLFEGNGSTQRPVDGVVLYDLNTPLFSDYTHKRRFIRLPEGTSMKYTETDAFKFPVGTVIVKTFSCPHDMRDPEAGERLLETRISVHEETGWYGFSYTWNEEQTEATLNLGGNVLDVGWVHFDGERRTNRYQVPNANQCLTCHAQADRFAPLGPTARNLNRNLPTENEAENQLTAWSHAGLLSGAPVAEEIPVMPRFDDPKSGSLDARARAWLDINCAHCHNPVGTARTSGLDLRSTQQDAAKFGVWKSPVAAGRGSGGHKFDIVPGRPEESILMFRLESDLPAVRMPSLARNMAHDEALTLIENWIAQMPEDGGRSQTPAND